MPEGSFREAFFGRLIDIASQHEEDPARWDLEFEEWKAAGYPVKTKETEDADSHAQGP